MDTEAELLINSPCGFDRYHNSPEATEKTFLTDPSSGTRWFRTGDCAMKSSAAGGAHKILGRLSQDIIKKSGYKISALEIEGRLVQHELVRECAVFGIPDEARGEEIVAVVALKPGKQPEASEAEAILDEYAREHMSSYKVPRIWRFVEALPRNQMGKPYKTKLKAAFE